MMIISNTTFLKSWLITFIVIATPVSTMAASRCESMFGNASYLRESVSSARAINSAVLEFLAAFREHPQNFTIDQVRTQVNSFSRKADAYFRQAGIHAETRMNLIKFKNLKDAPEFVMSYPVFMLKGSRHGDEIARMIYGVHSNPKFSQHPVKIEYDTLYLYRNSQSLGYYEHASNKIAIGPHIVTEALAGYANTLRHEVQHYFEQMKIYDKKMTMARITFSTESQNSSELYGNYFRMDELETHLRDIKMLYNVKARTARDKILQKNIEPHVLEKLQANRTKYLEEKNLIMMNLINSSDTMLSHIRSQASRKKPHTYNISSHGDPTALYLLEGLPYSMVRVNTYGTNSKPLHEMTNTDLQQSLDKILDWHWNRLQEIKKEFETLRTYFSSRPF